MTTQSKAIAASVPATAGITLAFITGLALLMASGYAQANALHGAAHDGRHAMAFPCH
jgi:cobalt transporter subunit CbtB